ncbi:unnamed protein product [Rhizoctonia solani]|uniref:Uncharacterized protein n=1 Tax=Rhizoctonia solani TaxID=456999 RepID=A0A8H3HJ83_9AGAM|nr:unnamed protein product [Rhizoctonia solani]
MLNHLGPATQVLRLFGRLTESYNPPPHVPLIHLGFSLSQEGHIMKSNKGIWSRWMYDVPNQLMFTLAKINGLYDDFGNRVDPETIQELEKEIAACRPVVSIGSGEDPILNLGRIMVQEAWTMAAHVHLYTGLCRAKSIDARVVKVQKVFMRLLEGVKSRRNLDSFLVSPIAIPQLVPQTEQHY